MRPIIPLHVQGSDLKPTVTRSRILPPKHKKAARRWERVGKPKSRSGCGTCKIRRVKCDEARPKCCRCTKGKFDCDGYVDYTTEDSLGSDGAVSSMSSPESSGASTSPETSTDISTISLSRPRRRLSTCIQHDGGSTSRLHVLDYSSLYYEQFLCHANQSNGIFYYSKTFTSIVLHESLRDKCTRNAIFAIGAFLFAGFLLSQSSVHDSTTDLHRQASLQFYNAALTTFRSRMQSSQTESHTWILHMTLLLTIFELLHGDFDAADGLWGCALQVLHPWLETSYSVSIADSDILNRSCGELIGELRPLFAMTGVQTCVMLIRHDDPFKRLCPDTYFNENDGSELFQLLAFLQTNMHQGCTIDVGELNPIQTWSTTEAPLLWCVVS
ncbi:unnamed protein product [Fusarium venenatum]|uniref:Zn(2)-C6 fungal-type domain-containing protein n=1 Tax=Fusarium venenatum TaxID=56646 RepID=A0A2L2SUQ7_9HYPO|nr:uncharacterized protein FVRRES_04584 [Fusarium venenatum]KAH6991742.1 hypothetical protein EDB82DRAFT_553559 [Fusarium venenatum]CEI60148.1 unnamed protein product [Fusarium venenatum]